MSALFDVLNTAEQDRSSDVAKELSSFRYINGGLYADQVSIVRLGDAFREALLRACEFNWGVISPAVFGSMFQTVKDRESRRHGGEHYTSERNILKTIRPLFLDEYRERLDANWDDTRQLGKLHEQLGKLRFLDPACGCGNFLIVAYRELRALELELLKRRRELDVINKVTSVASRGQLSFDVTGDIRVTLDHFYGIEIEEWPARIAETAMLLVDHLANQRMEEDFGDAPDRLPIRIAPTIRHGNALQLDWSQILPVSDDVIILGNPPFVAMHLMTTAQQEDRTLAFSALPESEGHRTGRLDYVACWYAKSIAYARGSKARVAFVSTNSLTQGDSARALDPILRDSGFEIFFAHSTFKWESEARDAAAVHCVILGFSGAEIPQKRIFDYVDVAGLEEERAARHINFYLLDTDLAGPSKRTSPLVADLPPMVKGSQPTDGGNLLLDEVANKELSRDEIAAKYIRRFAQSAAVLDDEMRWCLWMTNSTPADRDASPALRSRLAAVKELRSASPTPSVKRDAQTPWLFTQRRQPSKRWLGVPAHSSENRISIPMREFDPDVVPGNALVYIEDCPAWVFVILQSSAFTSWVRAFSGAIKSDFRISPDLTYNVFPFVRPKGDVLARLEAAAARLVAVRNFFPGRTLSELYDATSMPQALRDVHKEIDLIVDGVYGLSNPTHAERAVALLRRHHELVSSSQLVPSRLPRRPRR